MEPQFRPWDISLKGGNIFLNRFCVDEDAGFELSGVYFFKKWLAIMKKGKGNHYMYEVFFVL